MKKVEFKHDVTLDGAPHGKFMPAFEPQLHVSLCSPLTLHFTSFSLSILSTTISHLSSLILLFYPLVCRHYTHEEQHSYSKVFLYTSAHMHIFSINRDEKYTYNHVQFPALHTHTHLTGIHIRKKGSLSGCLIQLQSSYLLNYS